MELFIQFCVLNVANVVLQTIKSLVTVNCGKWSAAIMNAVAFGLYQVILVYSICELPLTVKIIVVATANFIGVFITKYFQERLRKDKLWKVEFAIPKGKRAEAVHDLIISNLSYHVIQTGNYYSCNVFCQSQAESLKVKGIVKKYNAKYFVSESKVL